MMSFQLSICLIFVLISFTPTFIVSRIIRTTLSTTTHKKVPVIGYWGERTEGVVVFLHESGQDGSLMRRWLQIMKSDCSFRHLRIIFPTSYQFPYNRYKGAIGHCWFNVELEGKRFPNCSFVDDHIQQNAAHLKKTIEKEMKDYNFTWDKVIIGGFSEGGAMALNMAYRFTPDVLGVFALSSFLPNDSLVYKDLQENPPKRLASLFYSHGDRDPYVPFSFGKRTFERLQELGVPGEFRCEPNTVHEIRHFTFDALFEWVNKLIPPPTEHIDLFHWFRAPTTMSKITSQTTTKKRT